MPAHHGGRFCSRFSTIHKGALTLESCLPDNFIDSQRRSVQVIEQVMFGAMRDHDQVSTFKPYRLAAVLNPYPPRPTADERRCGSKGCPAPSRCAGSR